MSRTFLEMKTNVGIDTQDTSSALATIIGRYLNRRYQKVIRQVNFDYINQDYTITVTAGTQEYELPADFKHEISVEDQTNDRELMRVDLADFVRYYPGTITTSGTVQRYAIYDRDDGSKYIKLHYNPSANITIGMAYIVRPAAMSLDTDVPILAMEDILELGAIADVWRYKRQLGKAREAELIYIDNLNDFIWDYENNPNQVRQFNPQTFDRDNLV